MQAWMHVMLLTSLCIMRVELEPHCNDKSIHLTLCCQDAKYLATSSTSMNTPTPSGAHTR